MLAWRLPAVHNPTEGGPGSQDEELAVRPDLGGGEALHLFLQRPQWRLDNYHCGRSCQVGGRRPLAG